MNTENYLRNKLPGLYPAIVISNQDPETRGRLQVSVPALHPDDAPKNNYPWAEACVTTAGPGRGVLKLPKAKETVWVMFVQSNPEKPVWMGSWWGAPGGSTEQPEEINEDHMVIKTEGGNLIDLSDESGNVHICMETPGGRKVCLNDQDQKIEITDGTNTIEIDASGNKIKIQGGAAVDVEVSGKSVKVNGTTNIPGTPSATGCFSGLTNCLFTGGPHLTDTVN